MDAMVERAEAGGEALADTSGWQGKLNTFRRRRIRRSGFALGALPMVSADVQASVCRGGALYAIRTYFQVADSLPDRQEAMALFFGRCNL